MLQRTSTFVFLLTSLHGIAFGSSNLPLHCRSGAVFVPCDWNACNHTWPSTNDQLSKQSTLQLFHANHLLNTSSGSRSRIFAVELKSLPRTRRIELYCIWKNKSAEICRQNITVDHASIPSPQPQNVSFAFYNEESNSLYKSVRLQFQVQEPLHGIITASVYQMGPLAKQCPYKTDKHIPSDSKQCQIQGREVVCNNLFKWHQHFPKFYKAVVSNENSFGRCTMELICKKVTFADIFGNLKKIHVTNIISKHSALINVSWEYPSDLEYAVSKIEISIRYCNFENKCFFSNKSRVFPQDKGKTFALIKENLEYDTEYEVQLRYVAESGYLNISPWTQAKRIHTLCPLPGRPKVTKCYKSNGKFFFEWIASSYKCSILYYNIGIEGTNESDNHVKYPASKCNHQGLCKFSLAKNFTNQPKSIRFKVSGCSNTGCNTVDVSYCTLRALTARSVLSAEKDTHIVEPIIMLASSCAGLLLLAFVAFKIWRRRSPHNALPPIYPRNPDIVCNNESNLATPEPYAVLPYFAEVATDYDDRSDPES